MPIVAECKVCGKRFKADEKQAGKKAKCSGCGTVFVVGENSAPTQPAASKTPAQQVAAGQLPPASTRPAVLTAPAKPVSQPTPAPAQTPIKPIAQPSPVTATKQPTPTKKPLEPDDLVAPQPSPSRPTQQTAPVEKSNSSARKYAAIAAVLALAGAAAFFGPKLLNKSSEVATNSKTATSPATDSGVRTPIVSNLPQTAPAWTAQADTPATLPRFAEDLRTILPGAPGLRYLPGSLVLAGPTSTYAAVAVAAESDHPTTPPAPPVIEVWNLSGPTRAGQLKLTVPLAFPAVSPDGLYYAGQWFDDAARVNHVEIWAAKSGVKIHSVDIPIPTALACQAVLGFPSTDSVLILGDKLQTWDLKSKTLVHEFPAPIKGEDVRAAASANFKFVAIADARSLFLIDLSLGKVLGPASIPDALVANPRRRLALRSIDFSNKQDELALVFDNRQSIRRIAVYSVTNGQLKELHTPTAPLYSGGPDFSWLGDDATFLVGSGILLDRATDRQVGQIYGDLKDEGIGGMLCSLLADDRALVAWDKFPKGMVVRSIPISRERPDWLNINLISASAQRFEKVQCVSSEFGNQSPRQTLSQTGRLTDGSQFLVVNLNFSAALTADAPELLSLRSDQFELIASGQPHPPIGTLTRAGNFSLEKPAIDLRKGEAVNRTRAVVFAISPQDRDFVVRIGAVEKALNVTQEIAVQPPPLLERTVRETLVPSLFSLPDDASAVTARVESARIRPYEVDPQAADNVPLRVTYSANDLLLTVNVELTINTARTYSRGTRAEPPKLGLLLPDGTHLLPALELPATLPALLSTGERRSQTLMFVLDKNPGTFRLTWDQTPVATIKPDAPTAARLMP